MRAVKTFFMAIITLIVVFLSIHPIGWMFMIVWLGETGYMAQLFNYWKRLFKQTNVHV